jgi:hypothetical protein
LLVLLLQVLGHTKTILVLLASWWVFNEPMVPRKLLGMALAVVGMSAYGHAAVQRSSNAQKQQAKRLKDGADVDGFAQVVVPAAAGTAARESKAEGPAAHPIRLSQTSGCSSSTSGDGAGVDVRSRGPRQQLA